MLRAVLYCHENSILHRDIKWENFLVDITDDGKIWVKLSDFGLATLYENYKPLTRRCGSILSVAPEMLISEAYDYKVDIWALGVVLYELLSTRLPFYAESDEDYR